MPYTPATPTVTATAVDSQTIQVEISGDDPNTTDFELQYAEGKTAETVEEGDWVTIESNLLDDGVTVTYTHTPVAPGMSHAYRARGWNRGEG